MGASASSAAWSNVWKHGGNPTCAVCGVQGGDDFLVTALFSGEQHTYIAFQHAFEGQELSTSAGFDSEGKGTVGVTQTVKEGQVLVKFLSAGEQSTEDGRQSKTCCCSCYLKFTAQKSQNRMRSLALELKGKGMMVSSEGIIILI